MRRIPAILVLSLAALLAVAVLPASGATDGEFVLRSGIPLRLAGSATVEAAAGALVLEGPADAIQIEAARITTLTLYSEYVEGAAGEVTRIVERVESSQQSINGPVRLIQTLPDSYLTVAGTRIVLESHAAEPAAKDAWSAANVQLTTLLQTQPLGPYANRLVGGAAPASLVEAKAGSYQTRATHAAADIAADQILAYGARAETPAGLLESKTSQTRGPKLSGATVADAQNTLVTETTTLLLIEPTAPLHLEGAIGLYSLDAFVRLQGYAASPWAEGRLDTGDSSLWLDGEQVLLGGTLTLRGLGVDLDGAAMTWLGSGQLHVVTVGPLVPPPSNAQAAAVAAGAGAAALAVAGAVYYWPLLKWTITGLLMPLYARVPRDRILDHKGRETVYERIRQEPGISTHRLAAAVDFGWSTLAYHLRVLEKNELVVSLRDGRYKRFFDRESGRYANGRKYVISVLRNPTSLRIAQTIVEAPGVTQKDLSSRFGLSPSSVHWHVERLGEARLVTKDRDGHNVRYTAGPAWAEIHPEDLGRISTAAAAPAAPLLPPGAAALLD